VRVRRLALAAVTALATIPFSGAAAAPPGPTDLPNALANPVESSFVEITAARSGDLVGWFDAGVYATWSGPDASTRDYVRGILITNGFVTGYQREWYMPNQTDELYETVFVFQKPAGAETMLSAIKQDFSSSQSFSSWMPVGLNDTSFGLQETVGGYHWILVGFVKGNDTFELFRGASADYQSSSALAQAREMYTVAPSGTALAAPARKPSMFSRFLMPVVITLVVGVLLMLTALVIAVVVTLRPLPAPAAPSRP
jgi:hypothetical protein